MTDWNDDLHLPCYCLGCQTVVDERDAECGGCGRSFAGTGRFDRISGFPPKRTLNETFDAWALAS